MSATPNRGGSPLEKCNRTEYPFEAKFRITPAGFLRKQTSPFAHDLWSKGIVCLYRMSRLAGKMRVSQGGHSHFIRRENGQVFVNWNEQKLGGLGIAGKDRILLNILPT